MQVNFPRFSGETGLLPVSSPLIMQTNHVTTVTKEVKGLQPPMINPLLMNLPNINKKKQVEQLSGWSTNKENTPSKMQKIGQKQFQETEKREKNSTKQLNAPSETQNLRKGLTKGATIINNQNRSALRPIKTIAKRKSPKLIKASWTSQDKQELLDSVEKYGPLWTFINHNCFHEKFNPSTCLYKYRRIIHPKRKTGKWSKEEDLLLLKVVTLFGKKWSKISQVFFDFKRSDKDCNHHYNNCLDPNIRHDEWTEHEDRQLIYFREQGLGWAACGRKIDRTGHQCSERFKTKALQSRIY